MSIAQKQKNYPLNAYEIRENMVIAERKSNVKNITFLMEKADLHRC